MHVDVDHTSDVVDVEHLVPSLAAVGRLVETAIFIGAIQPTEGPDVDDVGVGVMDRDPPRLERAFEAHVLPRLAAIDRLVGAVAVADRVARVVLASANPDDVRIRLRNRNRADRNDLLTIELVFEGDAIIGRLEKTTRCRRRPPSARLLLVDGKPDDAASHRCRPNAAPLQLVGPRLWQFLTDGGRSNSESCAYGKQRTVHTVGFSGGMQTEVRV